MGIKHFFHWFRNQFGQNIHKIRKDQHFSDIGVQVDTLLVDMNGIFHTSAQKVYEYGNFKAAPSLLTTKRQTQSNLQLQLKLFNDVCNTVESILKLVKPTKRLILCVDGPAPLSKQNQQRQRRFRSAKEATDDSLFNSNCITPGTQFMDHLTKYIDWYIRKRINSDSYWQSIQVIFSSEKVPGEGEHKLVNYIRCYGNPNESYCISGLDADLIMLALGTHMPKFYILREDTYSSNNDFFCIDVGKISKQLSSMMKWEGNKYRFNQKSAIDDFIFLCFMLGNDFLPHIPSIEIIENGIELILEVYRQVGSSFGHITNNIAGRVQFNPRTLGVILGTIGQHEKENFERKLMKKKSFFVDDVLEKCSLQVEDKWIVDIDKYKNDYYTTHFPEGIDQEKLCHQYLEGMQWVLSYYTQGVPNWKWNFAYHYAPPASTLSTYTNTFIFPKYGRTIPSTAFQQLLCVLPPKSANLIPEPLSELLTDENSPLKKYCPDDFKIDLSGKRKEWEGIVLLPQVNYETVRECYLERIHLINEKNMKLNLVGRSTVYEYVPNLPGTFNSFYGNIEKCCVRSVHFDM